MTYQFFTKDNKYRNSKLKPVDIYKIREEYDAGQRGVDRAEEYGIHANHYDAIGRRKKWKSLPEKEDVERAQV